MKVHNTVPYFLENYEPHEDFLEHYYRKFSSDFEQYFLFHCKNPGEK
ncbi:hypothetical protein [Filobacillus milosensis]|nr:hypothetical protein [Filobacillus milosensis]